MYTIRKVRDKNCYQVKNSDTGEIKAKCTTQRNAEKQVKLLLAIDHGFKTGKASKHKIAK